MGPFYIGYGYAFLLALAVFGAGSRTLSSSTAFMWATAVWLFSGALFTLLITLITNQNEIALDRDR